MKSFIILLCFLTLNSIIAQNQEKYSEYIAKANELYKSESFQSSADHFKMAFDELDGKAYPNDRYNAACSYALAGDEENAFYHLFYLAENENIKYRNLDHITTDTDLKSLHEDDRWDKVLSIVEANKVEYEKYLDMDLVRQLDSVYETDQGLRRQIAEIEKEYGRNSQEMQEHWGKINKADSINEIKVTKILDKYGWLGADVVGSKGNQTLFLVIQHADIETQIKYLPMMREAVKVGIARSSSLALLEDRVALRQGGKQIYGSQIGRDNETGKSYVLPLVDPENVNERRAEVGLGPIEDYTSRFGFEWNLEKHKARIEKQEAYKN